MPWWGYVIIIGGLVLIIMTTLLVILPFKLWFRALISKAPVSVWKLIGMQLRKNKPHLIVEAYINGKHAGINLTVDELETHYIAGGDVLRVVNALIAAHSAHIALSNNLAKAIDLAGRDVLSAVRYSVTPKVIETAQISIVASDGVELKFKSKITIRTNLAYLVGGAGEETIIARVSEGITNVAASLPGGHKQVLADPDYISKTVMARGLDNGTAFEIVSVDISDITVGRFVKAELDAAEAEKNVKIAQADAEKKRAMAIAEEQAMRAKTQEMKAQLLFAQSEVPKAIAQAFKDGRLGILDYYKMENMLADTKMRQTFAEEDDKTGTTGNGKR